MGGLVAVMVPGMGSANERRFGYVYETPVLSPGARELEVWNTYRSGKAYSFRRLDQRIELEFGVAERLMTAFYMNYEWKAVDANGSAPGGGRTTEQSASISNEWKYKVLDRVADPLGLALYGEYTLGLYERELEFKVILDKQLGRFLLAGNLVGEQEWEDELEDGILETEKELKFEVSGGVSYSMSAHFSLGLEVVEWNVLKEGRIEHAVLFAEFGGDGLYFCPRLRSDLPFQCAHSAHFEAGALDPLPLFQPREFGTAATNIDVQVVAVLQQVLRPEGVGDQVRFHLPADGLDVDAALHLHTGQYLVLVGGLAHGAGGAAAQDRGA